LSPPRRRRAAAATGTMEYRRQARPPQGSQSGSAAAQLPRTQLLARPPGVPRCALCLAAYSPIIRTEVIDRTEVLCAVSRLVVVRPVGAAPVQCVYSRPEASPRPGYILYNCWLQHVEGPRPGPGWCTGSVQHCREHFALSYHNVMMTGLRSYVPLAGWWWCGGAPSRGCSSAVRLQQARGVASG
jgi:hypothetical protein